MTQSTRKGLFDQLEIGDGGHRSRRGLKKEIDDVEESPEAVEELASRLNNWHWPLERVEITSSFGDRGRQFHEGADLEARVGTKVFSTADGKVAYSGSKLRGYGRMIVIEHDQNLFSLYAHLSKSFVKKGDSIKRGEKIALSGRSGRVTGPHLHFEIRRGVVAYDPVRVLATERIARPTVSESRKLATSGKKK